MSLIENQEKKDTFVICMMLGTSYITSEIPEKGIISLSLRLVVSIITTSIIFFILFHKNKYVKDAYKAVKRYLFKDSSLI